MDCDHVCVRMCVCGRLYLPDGVGGGDVEHLLARLVERVGKRLEDGDEEEEHLLIGVWCVLFVSWMDIYV